MLIRPSPFRPHEEPWPGLPDGATPWPLQDTELPVTFFGALPLPILQDVPEEAFVTVAAPDPSAVAEAALRPSAREETPLLPGPEAASAEGTDAEPAVPPQAVTRADASITPAPPAHMAQPATEAAALVAPSALAVGPPAAAQPATVEVPLGSGFGPDDDIPWASPIFSDGPGDLAAEIAASIALLAGGTCDPPEGGNAALVAGLQAIAVDHAAVLAAFQDRFGGLFGWEFDLL